MEFLSRSWSVSALEVSKALAPPPQMVLSKTSSGGVNVNNGGAIMEDLAGELEEAAMVSGNPFSFASSETSQMVMERIMSQSVSVAFVNLVQSRGPIRLCLCVWTNCAGFFCFCFMGFFSLFVFVLFLLKNKRGFIYLSHFGICS